MVDALRVTFDGDLNVRLYLEGAPDRFEDFVDVTGFNQTGRASAKINGVDFVFFGNGSLINNFTSERVYIIRNLLILMRKSQKIAVQTNVLAEGDVNVERKVFHVRI